MGEIFSFGEWVRRRRKALDLTQDALARRVGCALSMIRKIEADERRPSRQIAALLASALEVPATEREQFLHAARAELAVDKLAALPLPSAPEAPLGTLPTGTVTFLWTDIAGSTRLWEQHPSAMQPALARHDDILRVAIATHGGTLVKGTGDGLHAAFARATDAIHAALAAQRVLTAEDWGAIGLPRGQSLRVRMALHIGVTEERSGDYFGPAVNRAARLLAVGHSGQILLSHAVCDVVRDHLPPGAALRDLGTHRLKDLSREEQIWQLTVPDLPADFPPLASLSTRRHNLPIQLTSFVGRENELAAIARLLDGTHLLTLTGPGGMGKTRLVIALAEQVFATERYPDGVYFVALAPLSAPAQIVPALAAALDFPLDTGKQHIRSPRQQIIDYLHEKQVLLILDNVEHLLGDADEDASVADLIAALLAAAPRVAILATSRERLKLREEHVYLIGGLDTPGTDTPSSYSSVELFVERARPLRPGFVAEHADLGVVAQICRLVDGMPLAIELAAGWVDTLALPDIAAEIARGLDLLASELRDAPARHRSMRAVFAGSWRRLGAADQPVFARLAVFGGGGTRRAVQAVTQATLPQLHALVGASLLQYDAARDRYALHELLRQYAAEKLAHDPAAEQATRDRHAAYFCDLLRDLRGDLQGAHQLEALAAIQADGENVRVAWEWAAGQRNASLIDQALDSLGYFYEWQGRTEEGAAAYRLAAAALVGTSTSDVQQVRAKLLAWQSRCAYLLGENTAAGALLAQSQALLDDPDLAEVDTRAARAFVLLQVGRLTADDDYPAACTAFEQSQALFEALGDRRGEAAALFGLGAVTQDLIGDYDRAQPYLQDSLAIRRALDDRLGMLETLAYVSQHARYRGRVAESEQLARESYVLSTTLDNDRAMALAADDLGMAVNWSGSYAEAHRLLEEAIAIYSRLGDRAGLERAYFRRGITETCLGRYADARTTFTRHRDLVGFMFVALAERTYTEARALLTEAVPHFRRTGELFFLSTMYAFGAVAERGAGDRAQARRHAVTALRMVLKIRVWFITIYALWAIALLLADDGDLERAAELYALTERVWAPRDDAWSVAIARRELAGIAAALPVDVAAAAQARGEARDLWATARELLAELESAGWGAGVTET